jgi:hypothetical protein
MLYGISLHAHDYVGGVGHVGAEMVSLSKGTERTDTNSHGGLDYDRHPLSSMTISTRPKGGSLKHSARFTPSPQPDPPGSTCFLCVGFTPSPTRPVAHFVHTLIVTRTRGAHLLAGIAQHGPFYPHTYDGVDIGHDQRL